MNDATRNEPVGARVAEAAAADSTPAAVVADASTFIEALPAASAEAPQRYLVRVIRAGTSLNGVNYPRAVLREAVPLFNGARVFVKNDKAHIAGDPASKDFRALVGALSNARFVEAGVGEIQAELDVLETADVAPKLREAVARHMSDLFGLSVDAVGASRRKGDDAGADAALRQALDWVDMLAQSTASGAFAQLLQASAWPLRNSAWQAVLADVRDTDAAARAWRWLPLATRRAHAPAASGASARLQAFDRALAAQLLPALATSGASTTSHALLETLAAAPSGQAAYRPTTLPELAAFQRALPPDVAVMAWLDGGDRSAVLWITHERAWLAPAAPPHDLRGAIAGLRASLHSLAVPGTQVDAAAARVGAALWPTGAPPVPPAQLIVVADKTLAAVPWPLLPWPGREQPLLTTTTTRVANLVDRDVAGPPSLQVRTLIAAPATDSGLPALQVAKAEPALIRTAVGATASLSIDHATRASVLAALADPAAIVHVAAHGMTSAGRLGYAGLWLAADGDGHAEFLSWLDVIEQRTRARLVVLNACQLGADTDAIANGNSSFAQALVLSGAREVVAALWPVSDSASGVWVPAFYAALAADPDRDGARALRAAQLRLRDSRAFRHPYYWASLAAYARLPMQAAP